MTARLLTARAVTKSFGGRTVLCDLDVEVGRGDVVALVGPNGSGKTTALRCIAGLEPMDGGTVRLDGSPLRETDPGVRRRVCALLDDWSWFDDVTVTEHLDLYARAHTVPDPEQAVRAALTEAGLEAVGDQLPATLSSGQTRRFALAQALVRPWDLLIVDEPEQRLDRAGRQWVANYVRGSAEHGRSVLMACHDADVTRASGARVVRLGDSD